MHSPQSAYQALEETIAHLQANNSVNFDRSAESLPILMQDSSQGFVGKQTLVLGNNYNLGGWGVLGGVIVGIGIGYLWFGRSRIVL